MTDTNATNCRGPIPSHLNKYAWYAHHQAWLRDIGCLHHDPGDATAIRANLSGANLRGANLRDVDLSGVDLSDVDLSGANLSGANLSGVNLSGANLRGVNLSDVDIPVVPNLDRKILEAIDAGGRLRMCNWHTCETTHCRAGWAITLAAEAGGKALEDAIGPAAAGALIYHASTGRVPDFFASDEAAMADIRKCAGQASLREGSDGASDDCSADRAHARIGGGEHSVAAGRWMT